MDARDKIEAYADGHRAGMTDRDSGAKNARTLATPASADEWSRHYADGYRDAYHDAQVIENAGACNGPQEPRRDAARAACLT